jgi:hypothetical protein
MIDMKMSTSVSALTMSPLSMGPGLAISPKGWEAAEYSCYRCLAIRSRYTGLHTLMIP